ncbi:acyl carrier protein [Streptomyces poriferorum]|uniref:acyl carrier protein n=1 Tax=Streptomyces poriferorum TaxID=2798799 RepID=UPI003531E4C8
MTTARTEPADPATEPLSTWLSSLIADLLGLDEPFPAGLPLGELGIDSLTAAQLSVEAEEHTGVHVPLTRFLGDETLDDIVRALADAPVPGPAAGATA